MTSKRGDQQAHPRLEHAVEEHAAQAERPQAHEDCDHNLPCVVVVTVEQGGQGCRDEVDGAHEVCTRTQA